MSETQDKRNRVCEIGRQSDQLILSRETGRSQHQAIKPTLRFAPTSLIQNSKLACPRAPVLC